MGKAVRTLRQVSAELAKLNRLVDLVPYMSFFGNSNRDAIKAQIEVLKCYSGESCIHDRFGHDDGLLFQALEALYWRNGDSNEAPSVGWRELAAAKAPTKPEGRKARKAGA